MTDTREPGRVMENLDGASFFYSSPTIKVLEQARELTELARSGCRYEGQRNESHARCAARSGNDREADIFYCRAALEFECAGLQNDARRCRARIRRAAS